MKQMIFLNSRERKVLFSRLEESFGFSDVSVFDEYDFFSKGDSELEKIYLVGRDALSLVKFESIRIDTFGMLFATVSKHSIILSIEGSQLIGPKSTKNVVVLEAGIFKRFAMGESIVFSDSMIKHFTIKHHEDKHSITEHSVNNPSTFDENSILIVSSGDDYFSVARLRKGVLENLSPKERRSGSVVE
jgi:NOL1/NOP2/fmu family ribosome biogenesis protein